MEFFPKLDKCRAFTKAIAQWSRYVIEAQLNSFKGFFFSLKKKLLISFPKNYPVAEPTKAPIQLSEGRWFESAHGFYMEIYAFIYLFCKRVSGAYCGFMVLALLSKIDENYTFKATFLHQTAVKSYLKLSQI